MGQNEIIQILKKNGDKFFSADEIGRILEINKQSVRSSLKKLHAASDVVVTITVGKTNVPLKLYKYSYHQNYDDVLEEFNIIRQMPKLKYLDTTAVTNLMLLKEMRKNGK
jgi:predicted ArsR family transcriptional regulator